MNPSVALMTSNPRLVEPFLRDSGSRLRSLGIRIPLVIWVRPSMRLLDRARDLRTAIRRQAAINRISPGAQIVHHFAFRWLGRAPEKMPLAPSIRVLRQGRAVIEARSGNDPGAIVSLRNSDCAMCVIVGGDVLSRETLDAVGLPLLNVHLGDPTFVRGQPPVFWEILDKRESIALTLHEVTPRLDAGAVLLQRDSPILWGPTLGDTMLRTRQRASEEIASLLMDGITQVLEGCQRPRPIEPGPLRTTPTIWEAFEAGRICRERFVRTRC